MNTRKILFFLTLAFFLAGCNRLGGLKAGLAALEGNDTTENVGDDEDVYEEGEADDSEMMGMAPYEEETFDISELPPTAERQDAILHHALYVNTEQEPTDDGNEGLYTVWVADERSGTLRKVLTTNPTAEAPWEKMTGQNADAVEVPMHLIVTASNALWANQACTKIIVEGCPDARNIYTYIIDLNTRTAKQLPTTEGVQEINFNKGEIIAASYGYYSEGGRYTYNRAYSLDGKFLRVASEKVPL